VPPPAPDLSSALSGVLIEDRYLAGTRLRLRRQTPLWGVAAGVPVHKLGQKVRPNPADPGLVMHTTLYLSAEEHARLAVLPGAELRKLRHVIVAGGRRFAVDVFEGRHAGLVLVEIEVETADAAVEPPPFAGPEVTGDDRYSGGRLAG
jgi:hypothetical protein